jgi:hypothetical protein
MSEDGCREKILSCSSLVLKNEKIGGRGRERRTRRRAFGARRADSRRRSRWLVSAILLLLGAIPLCAAVDPVSVKLPETKAYIGQRVPFFVELRSAGSFGGATSFTLPEVPGTVIVKVGNPLVSSEQIEGQSWFVQSHEFALFSQREGAVEIPEFSVHFGTREGFTGPVTEVDDKVPGFSVGIERPPGTDPNRFLIATESLSVQERWNPQPAGDVKTGAVFKRTITQDAKNMTGMALAPAPTRAPDGIRVYRGNAEVSDKTERGDFSGQRTETVTYLVEKPGSYTLPAIRYDWWNPATKKLESKTLPAVTFTATAPPGPVGKQSSAKRAFVVLLWLMVAGALVLLGWSSRSSIAHFTSRLYDRIDPPDHRAARAFLRACRRNDALAAVRAWTAWERRQPGFRPSGELQARLIELQQHLYGAQASPQSWNGAALASAFRGRSTVPPEHHSLTSLPPLNP